MNKYTLEVSTKFKKDFKRCIKRGLDMTKIQDAMRILTATGTLPAEFVHISFQGTMLANGNVTLLGKIVTG